MTPGHRMSKGYKMTVTVQIETNTETGQKLITELRRYPDVVWFVEPDQILESIPEGYVPVKDGFDEVRNHVKSLFYE
jgi:hypothetical protein